MVVKFFGNKKGGSSKAIDYLLNEREAQGTAKVLQGDPTITREIINSIQFKQKVTVGCLSFEEKNISQEQKYKLMKDFENHLLPGMQDRYNILWVEHTDKGRLELNFVIPKIDLETQKSLNPYYHKADLPRVEKWQDIQNLEYGYSSPKDPSKKRTLETHSIKHINNDYEQLDKLLHNLVAEGTIKNREHLTELLKENGYQVTRTGRDYISIKTPESKRAKKFKGSIYNERFTSLEELRTISEERSQTIREYSQRDTQRELTRLKSQLREYTQDKYEKLQQIYNRTTQRELTRDRAVQQERQKTNNISNSDIKPNDRDNRNDLHNTEREPRVDSTSRSEIHSRGNKIHSDKKRQSKPVQRRGQSNEIPQNRRIDDDSTRTTTNGRTGTRESTKYRDYRETRKARIELYKSITEQSKQLRESTISNSRELQNNYSEYADRTRRTVARVREQQQENIKQSTHHISTTQSNANELTKLTRFRQRVTSYIKVAREHISNAVSKIKDTYNKHFNYKSDTLETNLKQLNANKEILGKETSFKDLRELNKTFEAEQVRDNIKHEQEQQRSRSRGMSMSR